MVSLAKRFFSIFIVFSVLLCMINVNVVYSENVDDIVSTENEDVQISEYYNYLSELKGYDNAKSDICLDSSNVYGKKNLLDENDNIILKSGETTEFSFDNIGKSIYNICLEYRVLKVENEVALKIKIDGKEPFDCGEIKLPVIYVDDGEGGKDKYGNEFSPEQKINDEFVKESLVDANGLENYPYCFGISEGKHTIALEMVSGEIMLKNLVLSIPDDKNYTYDQYIADHSDAHNYSGTPLVIEGESASYKTNKSIVAAGDDSSSMLTPASFDTTKINYIGGTNWKNLNDKVVWNIDVPQDGLYKIGIMYKQDTVINGSSYRHLKIDGYTPFLEASEIAFEYGTSWKFITLGNSDQNEFLFYLTEGKHELSLNATLGPASDIYKEMKSVVNGLGDFYLDVIMITSESPDSNRDYELFKQIPDYYDTLNSFGNSLDKLANEVKQLNGSKGTTYLAAIQNMNRVVKAMVKESYTAHLYVKDFYKNYTALSSWLYEMTVMPLSIDQIRLVGADKEFGEKKYNFFTQCAFTLKKFAASFTANYNYIEDENDSTIKIWVNWGRDQTQVLNSLIEKSFTPKTGIKVNLEIVNASLINGILSNNQPDLALHMPRSQPVNLAMRNALYDLSEFDDYEEVMQRFGESAGIPYQYNGGHYALPDQQSFYCMFYRTDIFEKLDIPVPDSWDDFLAATAVLQRNNMNSYIPYTKITTANTVDTGVGGLNLFSTVLMQFGGKLYSNDLLKSTLQTNMALSAFKYWTDMYTQYKIPTESDFYNRFRVGTSPLGVTVYTQYTSFVQMAPEIRGRWGIALVPGTKLADGSLNRTVSGSGTGCAILKDSENKNEAWEFLKWWTSDEIQLRYNDGVESILGAVSRITTANVKAFSNMSWSNQDLEILLKQRSYIEEVPEVPGSYYLSRSIDQAFWGVINNKNTVKDSLSKWGKEADEEISRKTKEYSDEN